MSFCSGVVSRFFGGGYSCGLFADSGEVGSVRMCFRVR